MHARSRIPLLVPFTVVSQLHVHSLGSQAFPDTCNYCVVQGWETFEIEDFLTIACNREGLGTKATNHFSQSKLPESDQSTEVN